MTFLKPWMRLFVCLIALYVKFDTNFGKKFNTQMTDLNCKMGAFVANKMRIFKN
jgi:hypothetical protein